MRLQLKKPLLHNEAMYGQDMVIDVEDKGKAVFLRDMGHATEVDKSTPLSPALAPPQMPRSKMGDDIGVAIADAIVKTSKAKVA